MTEPKKLFCLAAFCLFPVICFADPLAIMPTPYGEIVYKYPDTARMIFALMMVLGLGTEYLLIRLLTRRMEIKPLAWLLAFVGINAVSWPLATIGFSALENSAIINQLSQTAGLWVILLLATGFEVLVGIAEGIAYGMIFSRVGQLRSWIIASIVGNVIGFVAGFVTTFLIQRYLH